MEKQTVLIGLLVTPKLAERIKEAALKEGKKVSVLLREICEEVFPEQKPLTRFERWKEENEAKSKV